MSTSVRNKVVIPSTSDAENSTSSDSPVEPDGPCCHWCKTTERLVTFRPCTHEIMCEHCLMYHLPECCPRCKFGVEAIERLQPGRRRRRDYIMIPDQHSDPQTNCLSCGQRKHLLLNLPCLHRNICSQCMELAQFPPCLQCHQRVITVRNTRMQTKEVDALRMYAHYREQEDLELSTRCHVVSSSRQCLENFRNRFVQYYPVPEGNGSGSVYQPNCFLGGNHMKLSTSETTEPDETWPQGCLLYTSPSPRDLSTSRMPSSA